jgi:hypothetical protein
VGGAETSTVSLNTSLFKKGPGNTLHFNAVLNGTDYPVTSLTAKNLVMTLSPNSSASLDESRAARGYRFQFDECNDFKSRVASGVCSYSKILLAKKASSSNPSINISERRLKCPSV